MKYLKLLPIPIIAGLILVSYPDAAAAPKAAFVVNTTTTVATVSTSTTKSTLPPQKSKRKSSTTIPSQPKSLPEDSSDAKMFIYMHESGNDPGSVNGHGCRGLGQACPGSKLPCSSSDYACQDKWFTDYCMHRYGSWENAKAFWLIHHWW